MADLSIAILGLDRIGGSVGLALHRYMEQGGKNTFTINGFALDDETLATARRIGAIDNGTRKPHDAVQGCDIVVVSLSYDDVQRTFRAIADDLKPGVVILDASPIKRPSQEWADEYFNDEVHLVGMTPIVNPKYLFNARNVLADAADDLFNNSAVVLTPDASAIQEAVDLAVNFVQILGSKPRFLDPLEHDTLLAKTDALPSLLGVSLFHTLMTGDDWQDAQWFTNPAFGVLTRALYDIHPDALVATWYQNRNVLARSLDDLIATLQQFKQLLADDDKSGLEATVIDTAKEYERWVNHRYSGDWDAEFKSPDTSGVGFMEQMLGGNLADKLFGDKKDKK